MAEEIISVLIGGASFLTGIFAAVKMTGRREQGVDDRLQSLEKKAHSAPCADIQAIKTAVGKIEVNVEWLVRERKNGKDSRI